MLNIPMFFLLALRLSQLYNFKEYKVLLSPIKIVILQEFIFTDPIDLKY